MDHGYGLIRTFESCVQPRSFMRFSPPRDIDLRGKVAVVTGGSSGVAKEVIKDLTSRGATVYAGCRRTHLVPTGPNLASPYPASMTTRYGSYQPGVTNGSAAHAGPAAQNDLTAAQTSAAAALVGGSARLSPAGALETASASAPAPVDEYGCAHALYLDLGDLNSVEAFADRVKEAAGRVDILVLCAAIAGKPYKLSPQGHEIHYATNFLGHFALTQHLLPALLPQKARVVVVSSILHSYADDAGPDYRYPSWPALVGISFGWWAYCRSNLAKTWFGYELQRRHPELTVPLVHPGVIDSGLTVIPTEFLQSIKRALLISPIDGARTPLYAALSPDVKGHTFYHNVLGIIGSSSASYDVTRGVPHYDYALEQVMKFSRSLNDKVNLGTSHRQTSPRDSKSINASESKGINSAGFMGEEVNPTSGRVEKAGEGTGVSQGMVSKDGDRARMGQRR